MAGSPKRVCWDACTWIALIQKERIRDASDKVIEDRYALCRSVIDLAEKGSVEIATSGLCLVEVNKESKDTSRDQIVTFFENDYILLVPLDKVVGTHARDLMFAAYPGLKPPDASHLATALVSNSDELHTFDRRLLGLDGRLTKLDGTVLKICKPAFGGRELPLLDVAPGNESAEPEMPKEDSADGGS
jgi:predicted nucleic acid-binding protein